MVGLGKDSPTAHFFLRVDFEFSVFLLDWLLSHGKRALSVMLFNLELEEDEFMPFPGGISAKRAERINRNLNPARSPISFLVPINVELSAPLYPILYNPVDRIKGSVRHYRKFAKSKRHLGKVRGHSNKNKEIDFPFGKVAKQTFY